MSESARIDIRRLDLDQLTDYFRNEGLPAFRAKQVYHWLWQKHARTFEEMTSLSKELRQKLGESFDIHIIALDLMAPSKQDFGCLMKISLKRCSFRSRKTIAILCVFQPRSVVV